MPDYEFKTTFWNDFTIADSFGLSAIKDTFNRSFRDWKDNHIYLTELVLVLNWKIWQYADENNDFAELYNSLWQKTDAYAIEHLKGDELTYFLETLD